MKLRKIPGLPGKRQTGLQVGGEISLDIAEHLERSPNPAGRFIMAAIMLFMLAVLVWMAMSRVEILVSAQGMVVPSGRVKEIQAPVAGLVKTIHVTDGQHVHKGEVLVELDGAQDQADLDRLRREVREYEAKLSRLDFQLRLDRGLELDPSIPMELAIKERHMLETRLDELQQALEAKENEVARRQAEVKAIESEIARISSTLPLLVSRLGKKEKLAKKGFVTELEMVDARLEVIRLRKDLEVRQHRMEQAKAALQQAKAQRKRAMLEFRASTLADIDEIEQKLSAARQELVKTKNRTEVMRLRSPADGVVQGLAINHPMAVVTAAEKLLTVVPDGVDLEVRARLLNKDVGFVNEGQPVHVKVDAYEFTKYGSIDGTVKWVGRDAVVDEAQGLVYPVKISLDDEYMPVEVNGKRARLKPGMQVAVDIIVGDRTILEYFLNPILKHRAESLHER